MRTDSDAIRSDLEWRGIDPVIPTKSNRKVQLTIDNTAYAMRNRIERFFNKITHSRPVARECAISARWPWARRTSDFSLSDDDLTCNLPALFGIFPGLPRRGHQAWVTWDINCSWSARTSTIRSHNQ